MDTLTIPAVISAALVDAINPCAFAVLIVLMSAVLLQGDKMKALRAGFAFIIAIYISYFLMGLGLYSALATAQSVKIIYWIVGILAILVGLLNLKDFFWYGKGFLMEVPLSWRPKMKQLINSVTSVPGAFFVGFLVSLFLLPCTSGPYIVILGLLSQASTRLQATLLLLLYNLIFVSPMVLITFLVYRGLASTEKLEALRQKRLRVLHLIAGLIMLGLGVAVIVYIM
jgi:cytochrome c biogenesis protein CcdA